MYVDAPSLSEGDFGWWHDGFRGWERTRDWAVELAAHRTAIDGVFGFSQGAALTGLLAALRDSRPARVAFEFAIMVGGFTSTSRSTPRCSRQKLTVPSVHVTAAPTGSCPGATRCCWPAGSRTRWSSSILAATSSRQIPG